MDDFQKVIDNLYRTIDELKEEIHQRDIQITKLSEKVATILSYQEKCDIRTSAINTQIQSIKEKMDGYLPDLEWIRDIRKAIPKILLTAVVALLSTIGQWLLLLLKHMSK